MVFFICEKCGDTLKKAAVEKHVGTKCRSAKYLSCMDCNKDFYNDEYAGHISCITENQKYGGKDFVEKEFKGLSKQLSFVDTFKKVVNEVEDILPELKKVCVRLCSVNSLPRKEKKFINFCTNTRIQKHMVKPAWEIVERANKAMQVSAAEKKNIDLKAQETKDDAEKVNEKTDKKQKKEKTKAKKLDNTETLNEETPDESADNVDADKIIEPMENGQADDGPKKRKHKKRKLDESIVENGNDKKETPNGNTEEVEGSAAAESPLKKKNKKSKKQKLDIINSSFDSDLDKQEEKEMESNMNTSKTGKKKKNKKNLESDETLSQQGIEPFNGIKMNDSNVENEEANGTLETCEEANEIDSENKNTDYQSRKKKSKKKKRAIEEEEAEEPSQEAAVKKSKLLKETENSDVDDKTPIKETKEKNVGRLNDTLIDEERKGSFSWKLAIKKALKNATPDGMKLKKLEKAIVADYFSYDNAVLSINEVKSTLKKKIHCDKYVLLKDHVKLKKSQE